MAVVVLVVAVVATWAARVRLTISGRIVLVLIVRVLVSILGAVRVARGTVAIIVCTIVCTVVSTIVSSLVAVPGMAVRIADCNGSHDCGGLLRVLLPVMGPSVGLEGLRGGGAVEPAVLGCGGGCGAELTEQAEN